MQPRRELVALGGDLSQLAFQLDDPPDRGQRHAFVGHRGDLLDDADLHPGVAALAAGRALRRDDLKLVDAAQEGLLQREHLRYLPHGVKRGILIVKRLHVSPPGSDVKRPAGARRRPAVRVSLSPSLSGNYSAGSSAASAGSSAAAVPTAILRGLAASRTGMRTSSTPSWWLASIASAS